MTKRQLERNTEIHGKAATDDKDHLLELIQEKGPSRRSARQLESLELISF